MTVTEGTALKEHTVDVNNFTDAVIDLINKPVINPCDYGGDEICMLGKGICIGDSLTYGQFDSKDDGSTVGGFTNPVLNYPNNLIRLTGLDITNAGMAGKTFRTWWNAHQSYNFSGYKFAIIALGVNDGYFNGGWTPDALDALTSIVSALREQSNGIKIFITTPPTYFLGYTEADWNSVAEGIRNASESLGLYLLDFRRFLTEFSRENYLAVSEMAYGHFNAYGYYAIAKAYKAYISYIIKNNIDDFKNLQFANTEHSWN